MGDLPPTPPGLRRYFHRRGYHPDHLTDIWAIDERLEINDLSGQVRMILAQTVRRLTAAGCDTPRLDAELLLAHALEKDRTWLYTYPDVALTQAQKSHFLALITRRAQREPVAYIIGHKEFFGLDFLVNPHVLIPRPETELLLETTLHCINQSPISHRPSPLSIIDVGTGSGCLAVTLAKYVPQATLFAVDIAAGALAVARQNAERQQVQAVINFVRGDLLQALTGPFDFIISNPPYVNETELVVTSPEVRHYEPRQALVAEAEGLAIIEALLVQAKQKLKPNGCLLVEIGSSQGAAVLALAHKYFPPSKVSVQPDLAGLDRVLVVEPNIGQF